MENDSIFLYFLIPFAINKKWVSIFIEFIFTNKDFHVKSYFKIIHFLRMLHKERVLFKKKLNVKPSPKTKRERQKKGKNLTKTICLQKFYTIIHNKCIIKIIIIHNCQLLYNSI